MQTAKSTQPKHSLEELLAQCDLTAPLPDDLLEWQNIVPVGNEILPPWDWAESAEKSLQNTSIS